jgi:ATP-dependent DNA helicase RecG
LGVGPARAELLERLGIQTVADLLFYFPRDYQDLSDLRPIAQLEEDRFLSIRGVVEETELRGGSPGRSVLGVLVREGGYYLRAMWFNQPYMADKFSRGQQVLMSGKAALRGGRWEMHHPRVQWIDPDEPPPTGQVLPIYPLTEGLTQGNLRTIVRSALVGYPATLEEIFPADFLARKQLLPLQVALAEIHFPTDSAQIGPARRRFAYQELFLLQLALAAKRQAQLASAKAPALPADSRIDARIGRLFPFDLTAGQQRVIGEIAADMARTPQMNRLLQGDVGSGKTVVAVYAALLAIAHGHQVAVMAPTEILARQHARTLGRLLAGSRVRLATLTGALQGAERAELLSRISAGEVDLVVGTQAIVRSEARFAKLGLIVIDEQHKFGVRQRALLKQAGGDPHCLIMTATPIPRTLTMSLYGDLDVSTLADSPPGRQPLRTYLAGAAEQPKWWDFVRRKLREGRQAYMIVPLVEQAAGPREASVANLEETFEQLAHGELEAFRLGLVHGRMPAEEKDAAMQAFAAGETQVLVATSVVEVGIDVPNATLMTIAGAERFGLAQLHQLRGRIARGPFPGFCCVLLDTPTDEAKERLQWFADTTDGFALAELDLRERGAGDLFGTRQHGLPAFRAADLVRDAKLVVEARSDAQALVAADPGLRAPEHATLRRRMLLRYGQALDLGDVG